MAEQQRQDVRYAIDIRVFVVVIVMAMAISFGVGVGMGPTAEELMLPKVTSVHLEPPALPEGVGADDLHEPAGQVRHSRRRTMYISVTIFISHHFIAILYNIAIVGGYQRHRERLLR
jgi:hypothetical protein